MNCNMRVGNYDKITEGQKNMGYKDDQREERPNQG